MRSMHRLDSAHKKVATSRIHMNFTAAVAAAILGFPLLLQQLVHLPVSGKWLTDKEYAKLLVNAGANGTTASDISGLFQQRGLNLGGGAFGVWRGNFKPKGAPTVQKYTMLVLNDDGEVDMFVDCGASSPKLQHG